MEKAETIKVLATLASAYPNVYGSLPPERAKAVVELWQRQFEGYPGKDVLNAVDRLIATMRFAPTISEVIEELGGVVKANPAPAEMRLTGEQYDWAAQMYGGKLTDYQEREFWHFFNDSPRAEYLKGVKI